MTEPSLLQGVEGETLKEVVKFLFAQATEALKRWREKKQASSSPIETPTVTAVPAIFQGELQPLIPHLDLMEPLQAQLLQAKAGISNYADGAIDVSVHDVELLKKIDELRGLLETAYQQRLTFRGENREPSGPFVKGYAKAKRVAGELSGVDADEIASGSVDGEARAEEVTAGGTVAGVKVKRIG